MFPAWLVGWVCNPPETGFERGECRHGFLFQTCIHQKSHKSQTHTCGLEAMAHLVGKLVVLVVDCEHGWVSFRDASDVSSTLRSPSSGCLVHEVKRKRERCRKCAAPCDESLSWVASMC